MTAAGSKTVFNTTTGLKDVPSDHVVVTSGTEWPIPSALIAETLQPSTAEFLRAIHRGEKGFLELRAFQKGAPVAPAEFVPLPLTDERLSAVQAYARRHGLRHNIYHAIATRSTRGSAAPQAESLGCQ
jgi:hypothetical protein